MKKTMATLVVVCASIVTLHAFRTMQDSGIKGAIRPADAAVSSVWAISGIDTVRTQPVKGNFIMLVKPGTWKIVVNATGPYKEAVIEGVIVSNAQFTDVGEIKLPH